MQHQITRGKEPRKQHKKQKVLRGKKIYKQDDLGGVGVSNERSKNQLRGNQPKSSGGQQSKKKKRKASQRNKKIKETAESRFRSKAAGERRNVSRPKGVCKVKKKKLALGAQVDRWKTKGGSPEVQERKVKLDREPGSKPQTTIDGKEEEKRPGGDL